MIFNITSRLLINTVCPGLEELLKSISDSSVAISPLMENEGQSDYENIFCSVELSSGIKLLNIYFLSYGLNEEQKVKIIKHLNNKLYEIKFSLNTLFKSDFKLEIKKNTHDNLITKATARIDLSVSVGDKDNFISILLPLEFLRFFSGKIINLNAELIEKEIIEFLGNPINIFPDLKILLDSINESEIQKLFYYLQKKKLLTPYQISIMFSSFPQHSILIKNNLSSNIMNEVNEIRNNIRINKRDVTGGIYSIEEAIYMSMKGKEKFSFSSFMGKTQEFLKTYLNIQSIIKKGFIGWIEEMNSAGQLFYVLSITNDTDLLKIISDKPEFYHNLFLKYLPKKRLDDLFSLLRDKKISLPDRLESQNLFISNFKKLKIKKMNMNYENFPALLSKIDKDETAYLLFGAGWFVLSTALKNINMKKVMYLIDRFPLGAKYLIIDVLQGIVNPNVLHDEMQIKKARTICVNEIMSLYEDGIINI
jgi:hypothetical protein